MILSKAPSPLKAKPNNADRATASTFPEDRRNSSVIKVPEPVAIIASNFSENFSDKKPQRIAESAPEKAKVLSEITPTVSDRPLSTKNATIWKLTSPVENALADIPKVINQNAVVFLA